MPPGDLTPVTVWEDATGQLYWSNPFDVPTRDVSGYSVLVNGALCFIRSEYSEPETPVTRGSP